MPKIAYEDKRLRDAALAVIDQANAIIEEYAAQRFVLTLRQLYYQFVARDLMPNTLRSYKRLGDIVNKGRLAGLIDWHAIEDRTRNVQSLAHWDSPADIVGACASQFRFDFWENQEYRPEVWIEKEALAGVIEGVCDEFDVPYLACRGYMSQSEQWRAGRRLAGHVRVGQTPVVLHLGDHDPSGVDMTRDNADRLSLFAGGRVDVRRLALNMPQVEEFNPPPNPAKMTDARFASYAAEFGESCWELDALEPATIVELIRGELESLIDPEAWKATQRRQDRARATLRVVADNWQDVEEHVESEFGIEVDD